MSEEILDILNKISVKDLKVILKEQLLNKEYKIPLSKLKKQEVIDFLIELEYEPIPDITKLNIKGKPITTNPRIMKGILQTDYASLAKKHFKDDKLMILYTSITNSLLPTRLMPFIPVELLFFIDGFGKDNKNHITIKTKAIFDTGCYGIILSKDLLPAEYNHLDDGEFHNMQFRIGNTKDYLDSSYKLYSRNKMPHNMNVVMFGQYACINAMYFEYRGEMVGDLKKTINFKEYWHMNDKILYAFSPKIENPNNFPDPNPDPHL